jgi:hypothetical protein
MHHLVHQESVAAAIQQPAVEHVSFRNDLDQLLHALQNELADLSKRRADIGKRIRILDKTLRGLRAGVGQALAAPLKVGLDVPAETYRKFSPGPAGAACAETTTPGQPDERNHALPQLKRACRIALAEVGGPASPEDLYARIARRGSFPFTSVEGAISAIARALISMAEQGDVRHLDDGQHGRWECASKQESPAIHG